MAQDPRTEIVRQLNEVLTAELTAINQYFVHAKMLRNWGIERLAKKEWDESIDEMKHADKIIERILYLDGVPNVQRLNKVRVGETVTELLECDLALEDEAIPRLNALIDYCSAHGDHGTRVLLDEILESEEEHRDWIRTQLSLIERLGENAYVAEQLHAS